jgi:hypothetical protein
VVEAWAATTPVLIAVAALLRRLHEASADFVPPHDACWFGQDIHVELPADLPPEPPADVVSHFDVTPQNVVFRNGEPVALIDFDLTRPGSRLRDVVNTAMWWVPLMPAADRDPAFATSDTPSRLTRFVAAYDLDDDARAAFPDVAIDGATRSWHLMRANAEQRGGGWARMWAEGAGDRIRRRKGLAARRARDPRVCPAARLGPRRYSRTTTIDAGWAAIHERSRSSVCICWAFVFKEPRNETSTSSSAICVTTTFESNAKNAFSR